MGLAAALSNMIDIAARTAWTQSGGCKSCEFGRTIWHYDGLKLVTVPLACCRRPLSRPLDFKVFVAVAKRLSRNT